MKPGDRVIYIADPLLYGVMEIARVRKDGHLECRSAFRSAAWPKNLLEVFDAHELDLAPVGAIEPDFASPLAKDVELDIERGQE
jgi:hypothetical protein